jgi:hypothetical protein
MMEEQVKRGGRGKGIKPALVHINLRVPESVLEFYKRYPSYTGKMREVLIAYKEKVESQDPDT